MAGSGTASLPGSPALRVRRLRVRAPAGEAPRIRAALERADWPTAPGRAWVLVRGLRVSCAGPVLADRARARVEALVREAVPVGSPGADGAEAVYCRDLADLVAALCADLAAGRAAGRWYWRGWSALLGLPRGHALARLLAQSPEVMNTVTERLARRGGLAAVWRLLEPADVATLMHGLAGWLGRTLPGPPSAGSKPASRARSPAAPAGLTGRWSVPLRDLDREDPRRWLAACLCALEWRPAALDSAEALTDLAAALGGEVCPREARPGGPGTGPGAFAGERESGDGARRPRQDDLPRGDPTPGDGRRRTTGSPGGAESPHAFVPGLGREPLPAGADGRWRPPADGAPRSPSVPSRPETQTEGWPKAWSGIGAADAMRVGVRPGGDRVDGDGRIRESARVGTAAPSGPALGARRAAGDRLRDCDPRGGPAEPHAPGAAPTLFADEGLAIRHGGLFYLINFLSRPEARALIAAHGDTAAGPDGWSLVWDLGRRLGLGPDPGLARFFAERLGLGLEDSPWDRPGLGVGRGLYALGVRLYGPELFDASLLAVPAWLHHTPSHLDLDLPLAAVRVEVRRVALDIDPGWVPWLGRVVTFRYRGHWDDASQETGG
jgi:hypothetical protein